MIFKTKCPWIVVDTDQMEYLCQHCGTHMKAPTEGMAIVMIGIVMDEFQNEHKNCVVTHPRNTTGKQNEETQKTPMDCNRYEQRRICLPALQNTHARPNRPNVIWNAIRHDGRIQNGTCEL